MRRFGWLLAVGLLLAVALPRAAAADTSDFVITNFAASYALSQADPQGELQIDEHIAVDFHAYNHGILRALPETYNGHSLQLKIDSVKIDGGPGAYTTYTSNGNEVLKIGDASTTITGAHSYDIRYHVDNVIRFLSDHDELDWNVNGTQWRQPFTAVSAQLTEASGLTAQVRSPRCYTGASGSTAGDCAASPLSDGANFVTTRTLSPGENLTFTVSFAKGTFSPPTAADWWRDHAAQLLAAVGLPLAVLLVAGSLWWRNGKDIGGRGTVIPEYGLPDDLRPAEIDTVLHYKLGKNAISATIIDLAIRHYLKIQEIETDGLFGLGKSKSYSFSRLPAPANDSLKDYEVRILNQLFSAGTTVEMAVLRTTFYKTAQTVQKLVPKDLTAAGYFARDPKRAGNIGHGIGTIVIFAAFFCLNINPSLAIGLLISGVISLVFASLMPRRTQKGEDAKDAIEGLKLYMNTAEKDRLAMLQSPNAPYAPQSAEPVRTVDLFEKLLPYAMVLGVEKAWGKQFESIYTAPPDWYGGNWTTFNAVYLASSLSDSMSAMNTSFAAPSSSGGGGGFSGGGGGGGGGGGW